MTREYLKYLESCEIIPNNELTLMISEYRNTNDRNLYVRIVNSNLRLVYKIAIIYRNSKAPFEDLIQEGNFGLLRAIEKFDVTKGTLFSSYAYIWIKQYIKRYVDDFSIVKLKSSSNNSVLLIENIENVSAELQVGKDFTEDLHNKSESEIIRKCIQNNLTPLEFEVISLRQGINKSKCTLGETASILKLKLSAVKTLETKAMSKLKEVLKTHSHYLSIDLEE